MSFYFKFLLIYFALSFWSCNNGNSHNEIANVNIDTTNLEITKTFGTY